MIAGLKVILESGTECETYRKESHNKTILCDPECKSKESDV